MTSRCSGQTSAPGICDAPANRRCPAVSKRIPRTQAWRPEGARFHRAHGRGVARRTTLGGGPRSGGEVRANHTQGA
jgi:hypothetical protein